MQFKWLHKKSVSLPNIAIINHTKENKKGWRCNECKLFVTFQLASAVTTDNNGGSSSSSSSSSCPLCRTDRYFDIRKVTRSAEETITSPLSLSLNERYEEEKDESKMTCTSEMTNNNTCEKDGYPCLTRIWITRNTNKTWNCPRCKEINRSFAKDCQFCPLKGDRIIIKD